MSSSELFYLVMVIVAMTGFAAVLAYFSRGSSVRRIANQSPPRVADDHGAALADSMGAKPAP